MTDTSTQDHRTATPQGRIVEWNAARIARALDLGHWKIFFTNDNVGPEGAKCSIQPTDGRRIAALWVAADWWETTDPDDKIVDLTHEVLHLAHHDAEHHIRQFFDNDGDLGEYVKSVIFAQFKVHLERMVDSLSYVLAPHMPAWTEDCEPADNLAQLTRPGYGHVA